MLIEIPYCLSPPSPILLYGQFLLSSEIFFSTLVLQFFSEPLSVLGRIFHYLNSLSFILHVDINLENDVML